MIQFMILPVTANPAGPQHKKHVKTIIVRKLNLILLNANNETQLDVKVIT